MSLVFPTLLPSAYRLADSEFRPVYEYTTGLTRGGGNQVAKLAPTIWAAKVKSPPLTNTDYDDWVGWLDAQQNGMNTFKMWDVSRELPRAYPNGFGGLTRAVGGGAFDGTCAVVSVSALNAREITLDGLPNAFTFSVRDYLAFTYASGSKRALHRVVHGGDGASDSGGVVTLTVEPPVLPGWADGDVVDLIRPYVIMQIVPGSVDYGVKSVDRRRQAIAFEAVQAFRLPA